jgi:hypothetical protein
MEYTSQNSWPVGQGLNLCPTEYEAGLLTTRSQCLAYNIKWQDDSEWHIVKHVEGSSQCLF